MRRIKGLIGAVAVVAVLLGMEACASTQKQSSSVRYEDLVRANSRDAVFARHKSFYVQSTVVQGTDNAKNRQLVQAYGCNGYSLYSERDFAYYETDYSGIDDSPVAYADILFTNSNLYRRDRDRDGTETLLSGWYVMSESEKASLFPAMDKFVIMVDGADEGETFVSAVDNGNGTVSLTTNVPVSGDATDIAKLPDGWNGATIEYVYTADARTLELKEIEVAVLTPTGRVEYVKEKIRYDVSESRNCAALRTFARNVEEGKATNPRSITVIYNAGTSKEERFVKKADSSYRIAAIWRDGFSPYKNADGSEPFTGTDGKSDITIYMIRDRTTKKTGAEAFVMRDVIVEPTPDPGFRVRIQFDF